MYADEATLRRTVFRWVHRYNNPASSLAVRKRGSERLRGISDVYAGIRDVINHPPCLRSGLSSVKRGAGLWFGGTS